MALSVAKICKHMELTNLTKEIDTEKIMVRQAEVNRPALQLAGFYDCFDAARVQVIGLVEDTYMKTLPKQTMLTAYERLFFCQSPCCIFCRGINPGEEVIRLAAKHGVPLLVSNKTTSDLTSELVRWMKVELAPMITIHGVLVDVYGEGVLITGESGIGKSEVALELIKRGHRLVSDDVVEIKKVSDETLVGSAPDITRHFIELRGVGIINVKHLFGVECVKNTQSIDIVIQMEHWNKDREYDRLGMEDQYTEILGNKLICHTVPIRPGRNVAIIVESAAVNYRQKKMGYNAARELYNRVQSNLAKRMEE